MSLLDWLVSHFVGNHIDPAEPDLPAALARVVGGTDPRLRAVSNYENLLAAGTLKALAWSRQIGDSLPPPVAVRPEQWASNPYLRAMFVNAEALQQWVKRAEELRPWRQGPYPTCWALLVSGTEEKRFFGSTYSNGAIAQDVPLKSLSFVRTRLIAVATDEAEYRAQVRWQVFDQLVLASLHALVHARGEKEELAKELGLLQARLLMLRRRQQHLDGALVIDPMGSVSELEAQLRSNTEALEKAKAHPCSLEECLAVVAKTLASPEKVVSTQPRAWRVNAMNIEVAADDEAGNDLSFTEFSLHLPESKQGVALPICLHKN